LMKQFNLLEIISTVVLLANVVVVVVDLLESSMLLTQATLQATHRCTPAPYGTLAVPAALPTLSMVGEKCFQFHNCALTLRKLCWLALHC